MSDNIVSYESFRKFQRLESENEELQPLPEDFFVSCREWMRRKEKMYENTKDASIIRELENILHIMKDIMDRREKKILILASHSTRSNIIPKNLLPEESIAFDKLSSTLKGFRNKMLDSISQDNISDINQKEIPEEESKPSEKKEYKIKEGYELVRITDALEKFVGTDNATYGPLNEGDVVTLPLDISDLLISKHKAEKLNPEL